VTYISQSYRKYKSGNPLCSSRHSCISLITLHASLKQKVRYNYDIRYAHWATMKTGRGLSYQPLLPWSPQKTTLFLSAYSTTP